MASLPDSPPMSIASSICVCLSDWMRSSGREVVLLKAMAGATQAGSLKMRVRMRPTRMERSV
jgi:hypothetical protein